MTVQQLHDVQTILGSLNVDDKTNDKAAQELSEETIFSRTDRKMYYFVREAFSKISDSEGFCNRIKITSEMLKGKVVIDAHYHRDLEIGDSFELTAPPKYNLRTIQLEI